MFQQVKVNKPATGKKKPLNGSFDSVHAAHHGLAESDTVIQTKASCPCGGGCPTCQGAEALQTKLKIGSPNDNYEREADQIADQVRRMTDPYAQRQSIEEEEEELLQTKPIADQITPLIQRQPLEDEEEELQLQAEQPAASPHTEQVQPMLNSLKTGGSPLPRNTQTFFESRFGTDFSTVRVHSDSTAAEAARLLRARAFTMENHITFGAGEYSPGTHTGKHLLAHELTHVIQQKGADRLGIQRYTEEEEAACPCLNWSLLRMYMTAQAMVGGGELTGRRYASMFMDHFLRGGGSDMYVAWSDFLGDTEGQAALEDVNDELANEFLAEADALSCGGSRSSITRSANLLSQFTHGTDLFYAVGAFTLHATGEGSVRRSCDEDDNCTGISAQMDIRYRINDPYDWKSNATPCTPATGETGCSANMKTVTLPVIGLICDECLNRLVIHGWAGEFMVKIRGSASNYNVSGPCGFRNPATEPDTRDNSRQDP